jgi:hypothetical protein
MMISGVFHRSARSSIVPRALDGTPVMRGPRIGAGCLRMLSLATELRVCGFPPDGWAASGHRAALFDPGASSVGFGDFGGSVGGPSAASAPLGTCVRACARLLSCSACARSNLMCACVWCAWM